MPSRQTILAAAESALIVFIIMAVTRPEPHTRFVAADGAVLPGPPLDRIIVDVQFDHEKLGDAVAKLAEEAKVNMHVNWRVLEAAGVDSEAPVTISRRNTTVAETLTHVLDDAAKGGPKLDYWPDSEGIQISTEEEASRLAVVTRVYDLRDLIRQLAGQDRNEFPTSETGVFDLSIRPAVSDPIESVQAREMIIKLIEDSVEPETWKDNGGNFGSLRDWGGRLIVTHLPRCQDKVKALLDELAEADTFKPLPPGTRIPAGGRRPHWPTTR